MRVTMWSVWVMMGVLAAGAVGAEMGDPSGYALIVQQSPAAGGTVTPGSGVHKIGVGQTVTLSAIPSPGYRFVYWLGDVSAVSASETSISVDSPKLVVAVFEREAFDESLVAAGSVAGGASGGSGLRYSSSISSDGGFSGGSGIRPSSYDYPTLPTTPDIDNFDDDVPVPGETDDDDILVPGDGEQVPEPTTIILLGLGATALLRKRK